MRISTPGPGKPMLPGLPASMGVMVPPPVVSVMPQPSRSGTPMAWYQRINPGETGAAPVSANCTRFKPTIRRTLSSTSLRASQ